MIFDGPYLALLVLLILGGIWTVMMPNLLKSAIGLAVTSAVLALLLFRMGGPLAGVFELSVCAGLITVVFSGVISLTVPLKGAAAQEREQNRLKRFISLPVLVIVAGLIMYALHPHLDALPPDSVTTDVRHVLWNVRRFDLVGQILIILGGVFGVVILLKERAAAKEGPKS